MESGNFDTLSSAVNTLTDQGYNENFEALDDCVKAIYSNKEYQPTELKIVHSHRFEGMTNPGDATAVFAIEAQDGTKGTLVMSYGAEHNQNIELIRDIKYQ